MPRYDGMIIARKPGVVAAVLIEQNLVVDFAPILYRAVKKRNGIGVAYQRLIDAGWNIEWYPDRLCLRSKIR